MANIKDVAKACKVSVSTVSYALNDSDIISKETKERIKQKAKELNYVPNAYARGLKNKQTFNIGVFIPGFEGPIHHTILSGIAQVVQNDAVKYNLLVTLADDKMTLIKERSVDIAVIMDARISDDMIKELCQLVPIVTFDKNTKCRRVYNTNIQNFEGMREMTNLMLSKGCKRVGYILGSKESFHNHLRFEGYLTALKESGIPYNFDIIYDADAFTEIAGYNIVVDALNRLEELPFDALVCGNDELALGAIAALNEYGYQIPRDVLISGFDNIEKGSYSTPTLTTISVDWFDYGVKIANLVLAILKKEKHEERISIPSEIIERDSTKRIF